MKNGFLGLAVFVVLALFLAPMAAFAAGGTLYIEGDTTVGITLSSNQSGTGWNWNEASYTLSLTNTYPGDLIYFNTTDTIYLNYTGNVTINATVLQALAADSDLIITGSGGTLTLNSNGIYQAISAGSLIIGGNAIIYAESNSSTVIEAQNGDLSIEDDASVTVVGTGVNTRGIYADNGSITIETTGVVSVTATGIGYALEADNDIDIIDGTVNLIVTNKGYAFDPSPNITGGVVTVNGQTYKDSNSGCNAGFGIFGTLALAALLWCRRKK